MARPKMTSTQKTKGITITLPEGLLEKLSILVLSKKGANTSRVIRFILEDFFKSSKKDKFMPELSEDDFLIPLERYAAIMEIGRNAIAARVEKGKLKLVTLYGSDYVSVDKEAYKNIVSQLIGIKKELAYLKETIFNKIDNQTRLELEIEDLKKKVNGLTPS